MIFARKMAANLRDLRADQISVVKQPFRRRCQNMFQPDGLGEHRAGILQRALVVLQLQENSRFDRDGLYPPPGALTREIFARRDIRRTSEKRNSRRSGWVNPDRAKTASDPAPWNRWTLRIARPQPRSAR